MKYKRWRMWVFFGIIIISSLFPLLTGVGGTTTLLEEVFAYGIFAMSYDLLLGYTGIISFGHVMFFGTGAYATAIFLEIGKGSTFSLLTGIVVALVMSVFLSLFVAFLSLRIKETYFAMITLAVGQTFYVLSGSQLLQPITNANDGMTVPVPAWLSNQWLMYYFSLVILVGIAFLLQRFVRSPVGMVLKGVRDNEQRATSLGHSVVRYKTLSFVISGVVATLAGSIFAVIEMFVSMQVYDVSVSLNVLLMTIIGGTGTLYGGIIGALIILVAQSEFANLAGNYPLFNNNQIIFGLLYIAIVLFLPQGILGSMRRWRG